MSFAGHVFDMINRQKQNRELLTAHRDRARFIRKKYLEYGVRSYEGIKPNHRQLSDQEKLEIRNRITREYRITIFKRVLVTVLVFMLLIYGVFWLFAEK